MWFFTEILKKNVKKFKDPTLGKLLSKGGSYGKQKSVKEYFLSKAISLGSNFLSKKLP